VQEVVSSNLTSPTTNFDFGMTDISSQTAPAPHRAAASLEAGGGTLRRALWAFAIAGLIFYASSRSHVVAPGITRMDDKFGHFAVYGLLGTLVCRLGRGGWWPAVSALVVVSAYGASDEWHQSFVPGRSSDVRDWIADTVGAAVAITLYTGWSCYRRWLEMPLWRRPRIEKNAATANLRRK
jgi:VanZ family protein